MTLPFHDRFVALFSAEFGRIHRYLQRLSGEPDLAADIAQEAFVRLYQRRTMPDAPEAWLISVAMNLFRNARSTGSRRRRLLTDARAEATLADAPAMPVQDADARARRARVRTALDRLPERERQLLLLRADGYPYRDIAALLGVNEASVGTLLARARRAFLKACDDGNHAF
jgi:RNA polymerase sigma-70 factor (ECF subfamily)